MRKILLAIPLLLCYNIGYSATLRLDTVSDGMGNFVQCVRSSTASDAGVSCNWDRYNNLRDGRNAMTTLKFLGGMRQTHPEVEKAERIQHQIEVEAIQRQIDKVRNNK